MNEILITLVKMIIDNYGQMIVATATGWLAVRYNAFLKAKHEELVATMKNDELRRATDEAFNKLQLTDNILSFINTKALDGLHLAEEKAFQSWKDSSVKELTGSEKKNIAVNYVVDSVKTVTDNKAIIDMIPSIVEKAVVSNRGALDSIFNTLKQNFVLFTGAVPQQSKNPFATPTPNVAPDTSNVGSSL